MLVDLHMHSYYSDGTMSPKEIVQAAKDAGVGVISITDHNRLDSWEELQEEALKEGIVAIRGVEIDCKFEGKPFHVLAYGFEATPELIEIINYAYSELQRTSTDLISRLEKDDNRVSLEDYNNYQHNPRNGGWKGLHYLFHKGVTEKLFDGFSYYGKYKCDHKEYNFPEMKDVCEAIWKAGGYSVLAHPGVNFKNISSEELIEELVEIKAQGIQGIECYYPTHSEELTKTCTDFCKENNLLITVGSDEHGEFGKAAKEIEQVIGCMKVNIEELKIDSLREFVIQ